MLSRKGERQLSVRACVLLVAAAHDDRAVGDAMQGMFNSSHWGRDIDNPQNRRFVADFEKDYGRAPTLYASQGYDAALLIGAAVRAVKGRIEDKNAFRAALRKADFKSVRGAFRFNTNHYPVQDYYLRMIARDGKGRLTNRIVGTMALCAALARAQDEAAALGFGLLLWDGYRPQRAVDCFLGWSRQPEDGRTKPRHYPNLDRREMFERGYVAVKSGHSRGSTVDLTLYHLATSELVAMGGGHDLMDPISHHGARDITPAEARNRQQLCSIMERCGFVRYDCEWWHYTLRDEPFPDTYFDFPITQFDPVEEGATALKRIA